MADGSRTPLGELLVAYRKRLGLSQKELAARTVEVAQRGHAVGAISVRTIVSLERPPTTPDSRRPRRDTVHALAIALGLRIDSPAYREFMDASQRPATGPVGPRGDHLPASGETDVIEAGRERVLSQLANALDAAANGTPRALLVRGESGTGKTTLVTHACRLALDRHRGAVVLWTGADDEPHGAFRRVVRLMLGDLEATPGVPELTPANRDAIATRIHIAATALAADGPLLVAASLTPDVEWEPILDRLADNDIAGHLARLAESPPDDAMRAMSGCEQFFRVISQYAAAGLVVLVIEDLDLADPASLASLQHLLNRIHARRGLRLAVIATSLPDTHLSSAAVELGHVVEAAQRLFPHGSIDIDTTTGAPGAHAFAAAALARAALPSDAGTVSKLVDRTGGNPAIMTGIIDALREETEATPDIATVIDTILPPSLSHHLADRVRRLPGDLQDILVNASVLGTDFHAETLMRMLDLSPARFIERVDRQLWRRHRLMRADGTEMVGGRLMHIYRICPPLLRDALYAELSDLERTHAHGRAADALRGLHGDRDHARLDRLAHHLERADRRTEAAYMHLQAGELARARRDFATARRHLESVARLGTRASDPETWIRMSISLGLCARATGDREEARTHLARALDFASTLEDDRVLATTLEAIGMLDFDAGDMAQGRDRILRAVDIWAAHNAPDTSRALANLSYLLYGLGHYDEAIASAERARTEATRARQTTAWIDGTIGLANCWIDLGRYDRAAELHEHALLTGSEIGDLHRQHICWVNLALIGIERGDWGAAEVAIDHIQSTGDDLSGAMEAVVAFHCGLVAEGRRHVAVAMDWYRQARDLRDRNGQQALAMDAVAGELRVALTGGDSHQIADLLDDLERRLEARGDDGIDGVEHPGRLFVILIEASMALERIQRAEHHARAAIDYLTRRTAHVPPEHRESYLSGVSAHRRILSLAASLGIVAG